MVTRRRKLRGGLSIWQAKTPSLPASSREHGNKIYDVIIIGAGISGACAAEAVSTITPDVLLIDRRGPSLGSTSASTALISWEIDEPLTVLVSKLGANRARASYLAAYGGVKRLMHCIRSNRIDCDLVPRRSLLIAGNKMDGNAVRKEAQFRRRLGLPSQFIESRTLQNRYGIDREAGILSAGNCELDPRMLTLGLLKVASRRGVKCIFPMEVVSMSATMQGVFLTLGDGTVVAGRKVIAATGYEVLQDISKRKYDLISTWALATKRVPPEILWRDRVMIWEASEPYLYVRTTVDNRVIVGGEDESFSDPARRDAKTAAKAKRIVSKLQKLLPNVSIEPEFIWSGTFATSPTGLPVIGEVDELPNVFAILGSGGNGITFSSIAAEMAKSWIRGKKHRHASLFAPKA
jgi:glycine/D-amino acid oxidase-like deaminating enzyme